MPCTRPTTRAKTATSSATHTTALLNLSLRRARKISQLLTTTTAAGPKSRGNLATSSSSTPGPLLPLRARRPIVLRLGRGLERPLNGMGGRE
ncbi:hypothetical protein MBLNU230_g3162t1 [Neophaeotheca triangularis]